MLLQGTGSARYSKPGAPGGRVFLQRRCCRQATGSTLCAKAAAGSDSRGLQCPTKSGRSAMKHTSALLTFALIAGSAAAQDDAVAARLDKSPRHHEWVKVKNGTRNARRSDAAVRVISACRSASSTRISSRRFSSRRNRAIVQKAVAYLHRYQRTLWLLEPPLQQIREPIAGECHAPLGDGFGDRGVVGGQHHTVLFVATAVQLAVAIGHLVGQFVTLVGPF